MKYIKFTCSNGYCGYDEDFYEIIEDNIDINIAELAKDILENEYSFYEPDGRFLNHFSGCGFRDEYYPEYKEDYDRYMENVSIDWEEITKEEYEENK